MSNNIASMQVQRGLSQSSDRLHQIFERLSSGQRINRASDDAAGLAISMNLATDSRVYSQGIRNFNDGVSLLNVADQSLSQLSTIVTRIKELAEQSANGSFSNNQRKVLDQEAQSLSDEFTRIIQTTKFNGQHLFDSDFGQLSLQGGYGSGGRLSSTLGGAVSDRTYQSATTIASASDAYVIDSADYNNDGYQDFAFTDQSSSKAHVYINNGDGTFNLSQDLTTGTRPRSIKSGDFNNDGVLDLVTANDLGNNLSIFIGNQDGTFTETGNISAGNGAIGVEIGDFNGDGNLDLVSANNTAPSVGIFFGNGTGSFSAQKIIASGYTTTEFVIGDYDGDTVDDIAVVDRGGDQMQILLSNGDGTFESAQQYAVGNAPYYADKGDLNGDGNLDLVVGNNVDDNLSVLLGNGDGTFSSQQIYAGVGAFVDDVNVGDLDGDGFDDVAVSNFTGSSVGIYYGNGDGTLQAQQQISVGTSPNGLALNDMDKDGILDILVANSGSNTVSLLKPNTVAGVNPLLSFSLKTQADALQAMSPLTDKLNSISLQRSQVGAFMSRVEVSKSSLRESGLNSRQAESQITSADIATESSQLAKEKILQMAATSVLAQANLQSNLVLSLLSV